MLGLILKKIYFTIYIYLYIQYMYRTCFTFYPKALGGDPYYYHDGTLLVREIVLLLFVLSFCVGLISRLTDALNIS